MISLLTLNIRNTTFQNVDDERCVFVEMFKWCNLEKIRCFGVTIDKNLNIHSCL